LTYKGRVYSGVANPTPKNLTGTHCASFIKDVSVEGSGVLADGTTKIQYNPATGEFNAVPQIRAADNTPPVAGQTVARDRSIIPGKGVILSLDGLGSDLQANDTGGRISGYRLDYYGGIGKAVCTGSQNANNNPMVVGACSPGLAKCPANFAQ
jgi:hypothetical protein